MLNLNDSIWFFVVAHPSSDALIRCSLTRSYPCLRDPAKSVEGVAPALHLSCSSLLRVLELSESAGVESKGAEKRADLASS